MNAYKTTLLAGTIAFAFAGGAFAQSTGGGGGNSGGNGSSQGQNGQGSSMQRQGNPSNQTQGGKPSPMRNGSGNCNQAGAANSRVASANLPPGEPVRGAANHGSGDWSDQTNCANPQRGIKNQSGGTSPRNGGG